MSLDAIRVTVTSTYWTQKPEGWTDSEWQEAVEVAKDGDTYHDAIDALCIPDFCIESEIDYVYYESADSDVAV